MEEIGYGLFNRDMIRGIKERWNNGGISAIYVRIDSGQSAAESSLLLWESDQKRLFWRLRLENEYYYLLARQSGDPPIEQVAQLAAELLNKRMNADPAGSRRDSVKAHIGYAVAFPSSAGRSTETVVYRLLRDALLLNAYAAPVPYAFHGGLAEVDTTAVTLDSAELTGQSGEKRNKQPLELYRSGKPIAIGQLAAPFPVFQSRTLVSEVAYMFDTNPKAPGVIIVADNRPVGLLMKEKLHQLLAGQFGLPLYWNRGVERIMNDQPLIVDENMPVEQVSQLAMNRHYAHLYDVVIITRNGQLAGAASIRSILECMTAMRTEAAREANPLTGLPGNEGIQTELHRRIQACRPFAVIYADLDYFKWFNDCFGFGLGDGMIRYLADTLGKELEQHGTPGDFVGHIGGDDFIIVAEAANAEMICQSLITRFEAGVKAFYGGVEVTSVEDRHGNVVEQEGVALSLSLMVWDGIVPLTPEDIPRLAAKLKKRAKSLKGSVYVLEHITGMHHGEDRKYT
ncbi:GGDEF domain-containing protein [Paenibacillus harenae]|uniref:GGDEF domain-containing protein n=1 Tax=Paenibacillus harenae TaxID=306543 RepID=UPI00278D1D7C|nr:GGDEF domain-containing protein [Paenibacillus harenae]MDQ0058806.1 diguanylate cyclase (GGDEF)-like protein [Paenibacillus harenae]